jgi:hypothetical protein
MAWECSDCNAREDEQGAVVVDAVCHHCGKPLCRAHQVNVVLDDAFTASGLTAVGLAALPALQGLGAVHCDSCGRTHHNQGLPK